MRPERNHTGYNGLQTLYSKNMSGEQADSPQSWSMVEAISSFDSDESALEALVQLKDLDFGDIFTNRDTDLDEEEQGGISIRFYHDEKINSLFFRVRSDSDIHITVALSESEADEFNRVLNKVLRVVGPITYHEITIRKEFDRPFSSLELPIEDDPEMQVVGIRIRRGSCDYIIQETDNDRLSVTMVDETEEEIADSFPDDFVLRDIEEIQNLIEVDL